MPSDLDIVIIPRDRFSTFPRCIDALYRCTNLPFTAIVVAGGIDSSTKRILHELQAQKENLHLVFEDDLLTQAAARNIGLKHATARFVVIIENDTIVHDKWLSPLIDCSREEGAAVIMPLIWWYRGLHAAGCAIEEREHNGDTFLNHSILYTDIRRKQVDYPESHCILIDRSLLPGYNIFDESEPFDVDFGMTLRNSRLKAFIEPRSIVTYSAPPPVKLGDIQAFKFRWDPSMWESKNHRFMQKWEIKYEPSKKIASYRRQQLKLGLAGRYPNIFTIWISNWTFYLSNQLLLLRLEKSARSS